MKSIDKVLAIAGIWMSAGIMLIFAPHGLLSQDMVKEGAGIVIVATWVIVAFG